MSHPALHEEDDLILKPRPRRAFELSSGPPTPPSDTQHFSNQTLDARKANSMGDNGGTGTPSRTKSFLNLTTSTLFGIYQPSGIGTETENPTPWGTGAQTPAESRNASFDFSRVNLPDSAFRRKSDGKFKGRSPAPQIHSPQVPRKGFKGYCLPLAGRVLTLFSVGLLYGLLISHLHDKQKLAPVAVKIDRGKWSYLLIWGCIGASLGIALPLADVFWAPNEDESALEQKVIERQRKSGRGMHAWMDVVRSIGAFVGIAFAIRKLPWQSTLQLSLTLALANPAVWYLIDRSPAGFVMSSIVSVGGTALLLGIYPSLVPSPSHFPSLKERRGGRGAANQTFDLHKSEDLVLGIFSQESIGVATWIASVLFVSSVCFGNIGRRLAPQSPRLAR